MEIVPFTAVDPSTWDRFCEASDDAWLFHRAAWITIEDRYFVQENLSFAVLDDDGSLLGIQPLYARELGLGGWVERILDSGLHRHTGLACAAGITPEAERVVEDAAIVQIFELAESRNVDRVQLNVQNLAPRSRTERRRASPFWVERHGFELGVKLGPNGQEPAPGARTDAADQHVRLGRTEEELWNSLDSSCRRAIRKADAGALDVTTDAEVGAYYELAQRSARRTGESLAPRGYFEDVWTSLGPAHCTISFVGRGDDRGAGLITINEKAAVHFLAGASDPEWLPLRVNDLIHWHTIKRANADGFEVYRLGPIFRTVPQDWPIARVSRFKAKWGAESVPVIQGSYFRRPERYAA